MSGVDPFLNMPKVAGSGEQPKDPLDLVAQGAEKTANKAASLVVKALGGAGVNLKLPEGGAFAGLESKGWAGNMINAGAASLKIAGSPMLGNLLSHVSRELQNMGVSMSPENMVSGIEPGMQVTPVGNVSSSTGIDL